MIPFYVVLGVHDRIIAILNVRPFKYLLEFPGTEVGSSSESPCPCPLVLGTHPATRSRLMSTTINVERDESVVELRDEQSLVFAVELSRKFREFFSVLGEGLYQLWFSEQRSLKTPVHD